MKKIICITLTVALILCAVPLISFASDNEDYQGNGSNNGADFDIVSGESLNINAEAAILMDAETGTLLYAKSPNKALAPASVTKIMTLLLVAEAIANGAISLTDKVMISANAAKMGGSQVFLEEGEEFTVEELLKCTVIASANDAAVALAEHVAGSESTFVAKMNERARELGMNNSTFENVTGLDDTVAKHECSAYDIALMSRELIKHDTVLKYSNVWQDSIRDGSFILTNTNRLVRYYQGCTGLKTGSTDKAGFCISATAKRGNLHLIAVIMGADTRDARNEAARNLLDYGFAAYGLYSDLEAPLENVPVRYGTADNITVYKNSFSILLNKADISKVEKHFEIPEYLTAPLTENQVIGTVTYTLGGEEIGKCDIVVKESVEKITLGEIFLRMLQSTILGN